MSAVVVAFVVDVMLFAVCLVLSVLVVLLSAIAVCRCSSFLFEWCLVLVVGGGACGLLLLFMCADIACEFAVCWCFFVVHACCC